MNTSQNDNYQDELFFTILHTNDEHSSLIPHSPAIDHQQGHTDNDTRGGLARLAKWVQEHRAAKEPKGEPVLLLSSGDIIGSNPFSWIIYRGYAPELNIMQRIGYDLITIGNHELHQGAGVLAAYYHNAGYPQNNPSTTILGTNVDFPSGHAMNSPGIYQRTYLKELSNGLKIGFLGVLGSDAMEIINQAPVSGIHFRDPIQTTRYAVHTLKQQGAQIIIAINHAGEEINKIIARKVKDLDIIIGGHEHLVLEEPTVERGTIIVEAGECLNFAGMLEIAYNQNSGRVRLRNRETGNAYLHPINAELEEKEDIKAEVDYYTARLNELVAELTENKITDILQPVVSVPYNMPNLPRREDHSLGNFVTDAMRLMAQETLQKKVDCAFQGTGIFRLPLLTGKSEHAKNKVSFYDLTEVQEITQGDDGEAGNPLISFYLTGKELRLLTEICVLGSEIMNDYYSLQFSGIRFTYIPRYSYLFKLPVISFPLPTFRSVQKAELFIGRGRQTEFTSEYINLDKNNNNLYHVVTDYLLIKGFMAYFNKIPLINKIPKNSEGKPIEDLNQAIIHHRRKPYKVWQAVLDYAFSQPVGPEGIPTIDDYYREAPRRIIPL